MSQSALIAGLSVFIVERVRALKRAVHARIVRILATALAELTNLMLMEMEQNASIALKLVFTVVNVQIRLHAPLVRITPKQWIAFVELTNGINTQTTPSVSIVQISVPIASNVPATLCVTLAQTTAQLTARVNLTKSRPHQFVLIVKKLVSIALRAQTLLLVRAVPMAQIQMIAYVELTSGTSFQTTHTVLAAVR